MTTRVALVALAFVISSCAMAPAKSSTTGPDQPGPADEKEMQEALEALQQAKSELVVPRAHSDCQAVCRISLLICEASERVCGIAARHPKEQSFGERCRGAEQECQAAQHECDGCQ